MQLALLGTPNEGSMSSFFTLLRGGRVGLRKIPYLVWFTLPALYELLPAPDNPVFVDRHGQPVPVEIYSPETWMKNRWGIFDPARRASYRKEFDPRVHQRVVEIMNSE